MEKESVITYLNGRIKSLEADKQKPEYKPVEEWLNGRIEEVKFLIKVFEE